MDLDIERVVDHMSAQDELIKANAAFKELTGEDFFLYVSKPGDGQTRVVFADGAMVHGYGRGAAHMAAKLAETTALIARGEVPIEKSRSEKRGD